VNEFREAQKELRPGVRGWWVGVLADLPEARRDQLLEARDDRSISHRAISVVLKRWGYEVTPAQVGHWRRNVV